MKKNKCDCSQSFDVILGRVDDYKAFKKALDKSRYPTFVGRNMYSRCASNGGAFFYVFNDNNIAVSLINPHHGVFLALGVIREHQSHGLGKAITNFLAPNFVRVIGKNIPFFEALGYKSIGEPKQGIKLKTQLMVREKLLSLAGRLSSVWGCANG